MKKLICITLLVLTGTLANAQVKIGSNVKTIGANSGLEVEAANGKKTIIDKATGQVTIQDGTEGAGKVLTSDANGAASWVAGTSIKRIIGTVPNTWPDLPVTGGDVYSGASITLPAGNWLLFFNASYANASALAVNMFVDLATSTTTNNFAGQNQRVVSACGAAGTWINGAAIYNITLTTQTTYHVWLSSVRAAPPTMGTNSGRIFYTGEGRIFAIPTDQ